MGMLDFLVKEAETPEDENKYQAQRMGLLAAAAKLGQMSQPGQNFNFGNALGQTGMAFAGNYYGAMERSQKQAEEAARKRAMQQMFNQIPDPRIRALAATNPQLASKLMLEREFKAPGERKIIKGADNFNYYADTGERVLPGVAAKPGGGQWAYDKKMGGMVMVTEQEIMSNPGRYAKEGPPQEGALDANQLVGAEQKLYEQFLKDTEMPRDQVSSYRRIEAIFNDPSQTTLQGIKPKGGGTLKLDSAGAADLALIFNFMKMLDPGSVVREGEFALAGQTGGLPDWLKAEWTKLESGGRLSEDMRRRIVKQARNQFDSAKVAIDNKLKFFRKRAAKYAPFGVNPERAIDFNMYKPNLDSSIFAEPEQAVPATSAQGEPAIPPTLLPRRPPASTTTYKDGVPTVSLPLDQNPTGGRRMRYNPATGKVE